MGANANTSCPCCGQRLLKRHGVALSPGLADLFDVIWRAGPRGVEPEVLAGIFYPGKSRQAAQRCVAVNVFHLNTKLAETDFEVRAGQGRREPYRVRQRRISRHDHAATMASPAMVRRPRPRHSQRHGTGAAVEKDSQPDDPRRRTAGDRSRVVRPSAV